MVWALTLDPVQSALFEEKAAEIDAVGGILSLIDVTRTIIGSLLKRKEDEPHREKTQRAIQRYMLATMNAPGTPMGEKLVNLKEFAKQTVKIVLVERPLIAKATSEEPDQVRRQADTAPEALAGHEPTQIMALESMAEESDAAPAVANGGGDCLSEMVKPTSIVVVSPAPPQKFDSFRILFPAAVCYRVERATCFFQRYNSGIDRGLPRPFLLSKAFADRLYGVINQIIVPAMVSGSRNIGLLETSQQWAGVNTAEFWDIIDRDERAKTGISAAWAAAWENCRQRRENRIAKDGTKTTVLVASPVLLKIREMLAPTKGDFTIPPIRNDEITLFASMLYELDMDKMDYTWNRLRQLYEQELDRRQYQDKAREGALRDSILSAFEIVPDLTGDFLALLCYFCFDNFDLSLLERFTHNKGSTLEQRQKRIPYLMNFLSGEGVAEARRREQGARAEREAEQKARAAAARA
jgi:hypothetical protein